MQPYIMSDCRWAVDPRGTRANTQPRPAPGQLGVRLEPRLSAAAADHHTLLLGSAKWLLV
jgi:hypothetical protein